MSADPRTVLTLAQLEANLEAVNREFAAAKAQEDEARRVMSAALNRLNAAQKALDEAIHRLRDKAPWNTDWHSQRHPGQPA